MDTPPATRERESPTRTFLFADLRGYTEFVERQGDAAATDLIAQYRGLVREQVARTAGAEIKTEGDSFYIVFSSARGALDCAVAIAREAGKHSSRTPGRPIRVGIGIHAGEPIAHEGQFVGSAVNLAARLAQSASAGEILISDVVRGLLRTSGLPPTVERELHVKGVAGPVRAFTVAWTEPPATPERPTSRAIDVRRGWPGQAHRASVRAALGAILVTVLVAGAIVVLRPAPAAPALVVVAGLATEGFSGDGGPAVSAQLSEPTSMAFDQEGALVFADSYFGPATLGRHDAQSRVRRVDRGGIIRTLAGGGTLDPASTDSAAGLALTVRGVRLAVGPRGEIYLTQEIDPGPLQRHWIARIDADGRFTVLAGGPAGYVGDGGPALTARLFQPRGVAVGPGGILYVADSGNSAVRAISELGIITTVAGTGQRGSGGDGGPAAAATLFAPLAVAVSSDGSLFIADTQNHAIRKIDHGGTILRVAGDGTQGAGGDGGPGLRAQLSLPSDLAFGPDGTLYVADTGNTRIRAIAPDGTIRTVVGPDGLTRPTAVAVDASGALFIADAGAHRIFKLVTR